MAILAVETQKMFVSHIKVCGLNNFPLAGNKLTQTCICCMGGGACHIEEGRGHGVSQEVTKSLKMWL